MIVAVCIALQTLAISYSFRRLPAGWARKVENGMECAVLAALFFFAALLGQVQYGLYGGFLLPSAYGNIRQVVFLLCAVLGAAAAVGTELIWPFFVIGGAAVLLPLTEVVTRTAYPFFFLAALLYFLLRRRSEQTKKAVLLAMMLVNLAQHLLKQYLYPQYWGIDFDVRLSTAYNLCALLIIIAPFVLLGKNALWKDFLVLFGTNAGVVTMAVPYWYIGQTIWQWDVFRYYLCHGLLSSSSLLIALLGLHRLNYRNFRKIPFLFFFSLILVCFNDIILYAVQGAEGNLWEVLYAYNPCWLFHPIEEFDWLIPIIDVFTPDLFMGDLATGEPFTPLLWYFIPMYLLIAVLAFLIMSLADRKRFSEDWRKIKAYFSRPHKERTDNDHPTT